MTPTSGAQSQLGRDRAPSLVSVAEQVEQDLKRLAEFTEFGAAVEIDFDGARAASRRADVLLAQRGPSARHEFPLIGHVVTVKELTPVAGLRHDRGQADPGPRSGRDAPAVDRLRRAGAVVLTTTSSPTGGWAGAGVHLTRGPVRNPWDRTRTPGGSSAGAAVLAALGVGSAALGTDGAGSVRIPAAFCGLVGLKPTYGRIPYVPRSPEGLSHLGPITRTVADAALMLHVMTGAHPADPDSAGWSECAHRRACTAPPTLDRPVRIAWTDGLGSPAPAPSIRAAAWAAVQHLVDGGHELEVIDGLAGRLDDAYHSLAVILGAAEAAAPPPGRLDPRHMALIEWGRTLGPDDMAAAEAGRRRARAVLDEQLARVDVLAMPTVPVTPFAAEQIEPHPPVRVGPEGTPSWLAWTPNTFVTNLGGQPSITVPCGMDADGLPVGVQLIAGRNRDELVLAVAAELERIQPWGHRYAELAARQEGTR